MTSFSVPDMSCGHCTAAIEQGIKGVDQAAEVSCDLTNRRVAVHSSLGTEVLLAAISASGYEATIV